MSTAEERRLDDSRRRKVHWKRWGPYLSERQWGTVREDYSADGDAWDYFPHDHARSRAYRWGEDGLAGISDRHQRLCFALALWNGRDSILKERLFGLANREGNHGEDVKEVYFHLDSTPTHSYMKFLYKYPQAEFPYRRLLEENRRRSRAEREFELIDTGIFDGDRYFDVFVEYAKAAAEDVLVRITVHNRGPETAEFHLLPTLWFRNTWAWEPGTERPSIAPGAGGKTFAALETETGIYGRRRLYAEGEPELLFTENETNDERLFGTPNRTPYVKDAFHEFVVGGNPGAVNPARTGSKAATRYRDSLGGGESRVYRLRFTDRVLPRPRFGRAFDAVFEKRRTEADAFYAGRLPAGISPDAAGVQRQAFAGLLWSKQYYHYDVRRWLSGDPGQPPPPSERRLGRNHDWMHLYNADVLSVPDGWEYPWYASWDLAFHTLPLAQIDPDFAKEQLILLDREWYMHPNGQLPAYEWGFGDVNPPVHAWAAWRVYKIEGRIRGSLDRGFLERVFHKLLLNFTWWLNRKDVEGRNLFQGGFLGLDNIGVFDWSVPLPSGEYVDQSDATSWMAMYSLNMLAIAMELAKEDHAYEDIASKFFEHFIYIAHAMGDPGPEGIDLWDDGDGFFYDRIHLPGGERIQVRLRSMVGLIPLFAVETLEAEQVDRLPGFKKRMMWFLENHPDAPNHVDRGEVPGGGQRWLLSIVGADRLGRILRRMLDENEFLSPYGIRALSRYHLDHPYTLDLNGAPHVVRYTPGESDSGAFGGNSNWRGPIWFPVNYLLIEALQRFHYRLGDGFQVEFPAGSGLRMNLWEVAGEISRRLCRLFLADGGGNRPVNGGDPRFARDPHWRDLILFHEYFDGDTGRGLGAGHQTGWTALVAKLLEQSGTGT